MAPKHQLGAEHARDMYSSKLALPAPHPGAGEGVWIMDIGCQYLWTLWHTLRRDVPGHYDVVLDCTTMRTGPYDCVEG